jgi:hypothetical protein
MVLAEQIFKFLKQMDAEAAPLPDGTPTGLRGYYAFRQGEYRSGRGSAWENSWTERLSELLSGHGYPAHCQCRYPSLRKTCDLMVSAPRIRSMWIEAKGSWRSTINDDDHSRDIPNKSFIKHLITAAEDVTKLQLLRSAEASHIGMLLIAFDTAALPITAYHLSIIRGRTDGWREAHAGWDDYAWRGRRVRCWFWWRQLASPTSAEQARDQKRKCKPRAGWAKLIDAEIARSGVPKDLWATESD